MLGVYFQIAESLLHLLKGRNLCFFEGSVLIVRCGREFEFPLHYSLACMANDPR